MNMFSWLLDFVTPSNNFFSKFWYFGTNNYLSQAHRILYDYSELRASPFVRYLSDNIRFTFER